MKAATHSRGGFCTLKGMSNRDDVFIKRAQVPAQAGYEAAGLAWLADAVPGSVVPVLSVGGTELTIERLAVARATPRAVHEFGAALRRLHQAGAPAFGAPPAGWAGRTYIGSIEQPCEPTDNWGEFYAEQRVRPFARAAARVGNLAAPALALVERACDAIAARDWDVAPARLHGDLWSGNLIFTPAPGGGVRGVMIDPAAHGGHPYTDLGMLALFDAPLLDEIFGGYGAPEDIWEQLPLHQLHPLAVHAQTHGPAYAQPLTRAAHATLELLR